MAFFAAGLVAAAALVLLGLVVAAAAVLALGLAPAALGLAVFLDSLIMSPGTRTSLSCWCMRTHASERAHLARRRTERLVEHGALGRDDDGRHGRHTNTRECLNERSDRIPTQVTQSTMARSQRRPSSDEYDIRPRENRRHRGGSRGREGRRRRCVRRRATRRRHATCHLPLRRLVGWLAGWRSRNGMNGRMAGWIDDWAAGWLE